MNLLIGKWGRRGKPQKIIYLNNFNRDNELMIRVNDKEWEIEVNGFQVGHQFGSLRRAFQEIIIMTTRWRYGSLRYVNHRVCF